MLMCSYYYYYYIHYESEFATGKQDACFRAIKELTQVPGRMLPEASRIKSCVMTPQCSSQKKFN